MNYANENVTFQFCNNMTFWLQFVIIIADKNQPIDKLIQLLF